MTLVTPTAAVKAFRYNTLTGGRLSMAQNITIGLIGGCTISGTADDSGWKARSPGRVVALQWGCTGAAQTGQTVTLTLYNSGTPNGSLAAGEVIYSSVMTLGASQAVQRIETTTVANPPVGSTAGTDTFAAGQHLVLIAATSATAGTQGDLWFAVDILYDE